MNIHLREELLIEELCSADLGAAQALNEDALPAVNSLSMDALQALVAQAHWAAVARVGATAAAFMLLLDETADYSSPNYLWFGRRYRRFLYVDRVVVGASWRRLGIGRALYREAVSRAQRRGVVLTSEVNLEPPNPASLAFHHGLGFVEVGRQRIAGQGRQASKTVCLLCRTPSGS